MSIVSVHNVDIYQDNNLILQKLNFKIQKGEIVYLVGKTGTGKSTLLKVLYCDIPFQEGVINIAGYDLNEISKKDISNYRKDVGTVIYDPSEYIPKASLHKILSELLESIGFNEIPLIEERISNILDQVGLASKKSHLLREISFGEMLLFKIATAILIQPKILFIDTIFEHLDPETGNEVMGLLNLISKKYEISIVIATNNYLVISKFPNRILTIQYGRVLDSEENPINTEQNAETRNIIYVFEKK